MEKKKKDLLKKNIGKEIRKVRKNKLNKNRDELYVKLSSCESCKQNTIKNIEEGRSLAKEGFLIAFCNLQEGIYIDEILDLNYSTIDSCHIDKYLTDMKIEEQLKLLQCIGIEKYVLYRGIDHKEFMEIDDKDTSGIVRGKILNNEIVKKRIAIDEFSKRIDISEDTLNGVIRGFSKISLEKWISISNELDVPIGYLWNYDLDEKGVAVSYLKKDIFKDLSADDTDNLLYWSKKMIYLLSK